jgi:hypothetical protein
MSAVRILNITLLLALGASLAATVSHFRPHAAPGKAKDIVTPTPVAPTPSPRDPNVRPIGTYEPSIQSCYERVQRTNPHFHRQPLDLRLTIGISGRVKVVDATRPDPKLRPLYSCIREAIARWTFPPNGEEYVVQIRVSPWSTRRSIPGRLQFLDR